MKKTFCILLALLMLCGAFALGTAAQEQFDPLSNKFGLLDEDYDLFAEDFGLFDAEAFAEADDGFDEELYARGEALLRGTLDVLTGDGWTIHYGADSVISYNGTLFATTWGIQRGIRLFNADVYYASYLDYRMYFDLTPTEPSTYTRQLITLVNLEMDALEFSVREGSNGLVTVSVDAGAGYTYTLSFRNDALSGLAMRTQTEWGGDNNSISSIRHLLPTAQSNLFNLRWMIKMPGSWFDPIRILFFPFNMFRMWVRTIASLFGFDWWTPDYP
ncbi:MAG: hypothetical protein FWE98_03880 [Oscillospiraceae bacterium]|nr:hypothetical protein [Oscillospiraceae bacterium]